VFDGLLKVHGDGVRMRRSGLRIVIVGAAIVILGFVALMYPYTQPSLIQAKARILGPRLTYASFARDDDRWSIVLAGVRSGDLQWLRVAAALRPALDTHPGEEMLGAVATMFEENPSDAVGVLLPAYGADPVCGVDEEGLPLDVSRAQQRIAILKRQRTSVGLQACLNILSRLAEEGTSRRTRS
jgi:hypothetical protein